MNVFISKDQCVLPMLLSANHTVSMVAITKFHMVSFHPRMTVERLALASGIYIDTKRKPYQRPFTDIAQEVKSAGSELYEFNTSWKRPCGYECPELLRATRTNIGLFNWSGDGLDVVVAAWQHSDVQWAIGSTCQNPHCAVNA